MSDRLYVVVNKESGRVFNTPGGEAWCRSIVRVLGDVWEVRQA